MKESRRERFTATLRALLDTLRAAADTGGDPRELLAERLAERGLEASAVGDLLEWIIEIWWEGAPATWLMEDSGEPPSPRSVRLLTEAEGRYLSPEAQRYVVDLRQSGRISWRQFELLIHLVGLSEGPRLRRDDVDNLLERIIAAEDGRWRTERDERRH